ncbi:MAG: hypothetical protein HY378_01375 [Candidatus Brennerbacteria bacterium]|nr:hypothetical protein [Candidatus Brennerbacteria bacterium]
MILTTHAVTGAALATIFPNQPVVGFLAAFASHFVLDAIPHWDYPIATASLKPEVSGKLKFEKSLAVDAVRIGSDFFLGLLLAVSFFAPVVSLSFALLGAAGGLLPDFLQFAYTRFPREPFSSLQRFHTRIHAKKKLAMSAGIAVQVLIVLVLIFSLG